VDAGDPPVPALNRLMLGLLGLRIFEATGADIADLGEEHGHRVLRVCGKGTKIVLVPLPSAVGRAIDRAIGSRSRGPVLVNTRGARMDRHAATRRPRQASVMITRAPSSYAQTHYVTTMLDGGVDLRDVQIAARHADPPDHDALRPGPQKPRPSPQLHSCRLYGFRHLIPASPWL